MKRSTAVAIALGILAGGLPVRLTATLLAGPDAHMRGELLLGIWLFKAVLLLHGLLVLVLARVRPPAHTSAPPLAPYRAGTKEGDLVSEAGAIRLLGVLLAVATALRLYGLNEGLWFDEIKTLVVYVRRPIGVLLTTFDGKNQHLGYSVAAKLSVSLFGEVPWALRLPAVLFAIASIAAVYAYGRRITGRTEALLAAALLTFSYHHVWFSQNARGYTGLLFWTLVSSLLFVRMLTTAEFSGWKLSVGYGLAAALAVYTHFTGVVVVLAHGLIAILALWRAGRSGRRKPAFASATARSLALAFLLSGSLTLLFYAPVLPQMAATLLTPSMPGSDVEWKNPLWLLAESVRVLSRGVPGGLAGLGAGLLVVIAGSVAYLRQSSTVLLVMLLPAVITLVAILSLEQNLWPRFFFFSAGFAVLIVPRGVVVLIRRVVPGSRARAPKAAAGLVVALVLASATTIPRAWGPKQDFWGAVQFVDEHADPGDAVVTVDAAIFPYENYVVRAWSSAQTEAELVRIEERHDRTWVVYTFPASIDERLWERLGRDYREAAVFAGTVNGGDVIVKVRK